MYEKKKKQVLFTIYFSPMTTPEWDSLSAAITEVDLSLLVPFFHSLKRKYPRDPGIEDMTSYAESTVPEFQKKLRGKLLQWLSQNMSLVSTHYAMWRQMPTAMNSTQTTPSAPDVTMHVAPETKTMKDVTHRLLVVVEDVDNLPARIHEELLYSVWNHKGEEEKRSTFSQGWMRESETYGTVTGWK